MEQLSVELAMLQSLGRGVDLLDLGLALILSFSLTTLIAILYAHTHPTPGAGIRSFVFGLVVFSTMVSFLVLIIGTNITRSFILLGVLSLIRFGHIAKSARDIAYLLMAVGIGLACGMGLYLIALITTLSLLGLSRVLTLIVSFIDGQRSNLYDSSD